MPPARRTITAANWIAWVSRWLAVWVALGFLPPAAAESGRPAIEHYTYEETTGSHAIPIEYVVQIPKRSLSTVDAISAAGSMSHPAVRWLLYGTAAIGSDNPTVSFCSMPEGICCRNQKTRLSASGRKRIPEKEPPVQATIS